MRKVIAVLILVFVFNTATQAQNHIFYVYKNTNNGNPLKAQQAFKSSISSYMLKYKKQDENSINCSLMPFLFDSNAKARDITKKDTLMSNATFNSLVQDIDIETLTSKEYEDLKTKIEE